MGLKEIPVTDEEYQRIAKVAKTYGVKTNQYAQIFLAGYAKRIKDVESMSRP